MTVDTDAGLQRRALSLARTRLSPMVVSSVGLVSGKAVSMLLGFLFWLGAARMFPERVVGLTSGVISSIMLCVLLAVLGIGSAFIVLFPAHLRRLHRLLDTAISLAICSGMAGAGLFLLLAAGVFEELNVVVHAPLFALLFVAMGALGTVQVLLDQVSMAQRRGHDVLSRNVVNGLVTILPLPILHAVMPSAGAFELFTCWVGGVLCASLLAWSQLHRTAGSYSFHPRIDKRIGADLLRIGLPNQALTVAERAPGLVLPVVIVELLSPEINAYWYSAWMMAWAAFVIPVSIGIAMFAESAHDPASLRRQVRSSLVSALVMGAGTATAIAVLAPFVLALLGPSYAQAATEPLRILVWAVVPSVCTQVYYSVCRSRDRLVEAVATGAVGGTVGVGAVAVAGMDVGLVGMAAAWVASQTVLGVWSLWRLRVLLNRESGRDEVPASGGESGSGAVPT